MCPTVMVTAAMMAKRYWTSGPAILAHAVPETNIIRKIWKKTLRPIFLEPVARNRETGVAAPSYTSGAHMWKGTAAILNPYPAIMATSAMPNTKLMPVMLVVAAMAAMFVVPVRP